MAHNDERGRERLDGVELSQPTVVLGIAGEEPRESAPSLGPNVVERAARVLPPSPEAVPRTVHGRQTLFHGPEVRGRQDGRRVGV